MNPATSANIRVAEDFILQLAVARGVLQPSPAEAGLDAEGLLSSRQIAELLADEFGLALAPELATVRITTETLALVPRTLALRYRVLPLARENGKLRVAISDPLDADAIDALNRHVDLPIELVVATKEDVDSALERLYPKEGGSLDEFIDALAPGRGGSVETPSASLVETFDGDSDAPIIKLVQQILQGAVQRRASDIHVEPLEKRLRIRCRVDGVLLEIENPPKRLQLPIVSRLKIMANLSIAEKRLPQDGRIQIVVDGKPLDLRVSSLPSAHGESIVMRILDQRGLMLGLPELGFFSDDAATFEKLIALPDGIVLVTGPTGSGKTTTLYSCLHHLNRPDRKIITVEDPVEYQLTGINQVPVRHDIGMTFASALRAMLRQAPNIVMVGEIRDLETAEIAINASLTGHMVFSTLHTNDAPGAVTRLVDLGVKPFLVSSSLRATMAQRLVRKICAHCKQPCAPAAHELRALNLSAAQAANATFMKGAGCDECNGTGYRGRMGIFELFVVNEEIQRLIYDRAGTAKLREKARSLGMRTMREDGTRKVTAGLTTIEEVVSITVGDAT